MKNAFLLAASLGGLAACNKGPEVDLHNASANQVNQAVKQSGMMTSDSMVEPGLWESKVSVLEMNIPGMPPQYAGRMKEELAKQRDRSSRHCIKPEDVKRPKEDFFGADKSCRYARFAMGGGKMDIQMVCKESDTTQTTNVIGTYTPTTYSIDMNSSGSGPQHEMTMKMHVDSRRVGECAEKDD